MAKGSKPEQDCASRGATSGTPTRPEPVPEKAPRKHPPRPVSYLVLERLDPSTFSRLTGSVESWKKEQIGFRVGGRVSCVIEPGLDITGHSVDGEGTVLTEGTVIARLNDERYRVLVDEAKAIVKAKAGTAAALDVEDRPGVAITPLYRDAHEDVRVEQWDAGARISLDTPGGIELFVLDGGFKEAGESFAPHSWLRLPADMPSKRRALGSRRAIGSAPGVAATRRNRPLGTPAKLTSVEPSASKEMTSGEIGSASPLTRTVTRS